MVNYMSYESIKNEFESNSRIKFKLYSLEYLIERVDNYVQVYAIDYHTRKSKYNKWIQKKTDRWW